MPATKQFLTQWKFYYPSKAEKNTSSKINLARVFERVKLYQIIKKLLQKMNNYNNIFYQ